MSEPDFIMLPAELVERVERQREKAARSRRKYEAKNPVRSHHSLDTRPFIMWDGEGPHDTGYSLFGNSEGDELCKPGLTTVECLELILQRGEQGEYIHTWYGGNYDASCILHDLPYRYLNQLQKFNRVVWRGYRIEYVPRKWLLVSNGKTTVKIFDVVSFFATSFLNALRSFGIGTIEELNRIETGKAGRDSFTWAEIEGIRIYWRTEMRLGVLLMNTLRKIFNDAGFNPRSWHGPGALARIALNRHHVIDAMAVSPPEVQLAAMFAFAGGRFEEPRGGLIKGTIYNADKRSAYPAYARDLPNLARGEWRHVSTYQGKDKFGMYRITYRATDRRKGRIYPLFRRLDNGEVIWPSEVEGWYHTPEANLVWNDPDATFIEGWVFDEEDATDRPFAWIEEYFHKRMVLKRAGNPAEFTFKLIINSVYGQLAQRTGWDKKNRKAPRYHQLEWAGYITSSCRAAMYEVARTLPERSLVSIDTDGLYARTNLSVQSGSNLGEWEVNVYQGGLFWQSGIYVLCNESGEWDSGKTKARGIPRGKFSVSALFRCFRENKPLTLYRNVFHGFGLCLNGDMGKLNTWSTDSVELAFGGNGKRYHNQVRCPEYCTERADGIHEFIARPVRPGMSVPHRLPWLTEPSVSRHSHDTMVAFDVNHLDDEDRWVLDMVA